MPSALDDRSMNDSSGLRESYGAAWLDRHDVQLNVMSKSAAPVTAV